ncbi:MAG: decarboxylase [Chloroflexi bacterium]|nr:decarboxylase [Chloroflexota bacterium]
MDWKATLVACLKEKGVPFVAYVPDGATWQILSLMQKDPFFHLIRCTREDEAIGIASGTYAAGSRGVAFMQSSGLGNCVNVLGSLNVTYRIPVPLVVALRGELGEFNIAQVPVGRAVRPILESLGLHHFTLDRPEGVEALSRGALDLCYSGRLPVALLVSTLLTGAKRG